MVAKNVLSYSATTASHLNMTQTQLVRIVWHVGLISLDCRQSMSVTSWRYRVEACRCAHAAQITDVGLQTCAALVALQWLDLSWLRTSLTRDCMRCSFVALQFLVLHSCSGCSRRHGRPNIVQPKRTQQQHNRHSKQLSSSIYPSPQSTSMSDRITHELLYIYDNYYL
jgi:hypothetical protein